MANEEPTMLPSPLTFQAGEAAGFCYLTIQNKFINFLFSHRMKVVAVAEPVEHRRKRCAAIFIF